MTGGGKLHSPLYTILLPVYPCSLSLCFFQVLKFKGILDNATRADGIVKEKFDSNREAMIVLGKPLPDIQEAIPAAGAQAAAVSGSQVRGEGRE